MKRMDAVVSLGDVTKPWPLMIVLHRPSDNHVIKCQGTFALKDADAAAAVPPSAQEFKTPTMELSLFLEKPRLAYGSITF